MTPIPKISVIVSAYNQAMFFPGLLASLASQDCSVPFEVIVCDDGSADATRAILGAAPHLDIRHIWQPDDGFRLSRSRNNGIRCAQGEILVFIDADSVLRPYFLRSHWETHAEPGRLACGGVQDAEVEESSLGPDAASLLAAVPEDFSVATDPRSAWVGTDRSWMACTSGNLSVERSRAVFFDENFEGWGSEDRDWAFRLCESGVEIRPLDRAGLVHLRLRDRVIGWNPTKGGDHTAIVAMLQGKLHLYRKYPGNVMLPSLEGIRYCHLDKVTDTWRIGVFRQTTSVASVLAEFEAWWNCRAGQPV